MRIKPFNDVICGMILGVLCFVPLFLFFKEDEASRIENLKPKEVKTNPRWDEGCPHPFEDEPYPVCEYNDDWKNKVKKRSNNGF